LPSLDGATYAVPLSHAIREVAHDLTAALGEEMEAHFPPFVELRFHDLDAIRLDTSHYLKLCALYRMHHVVTCTTSPETSRWPPPSLLYAVLRHYQSGMSADDGSFEGAGFHAATPGSVVHVLHQHLGVTRELFASPLNCYFPTFASPYVSDAVFGSVGSFWDQALIEGSFQVNPPFTEQVIVLTVERLLAALAAVTQAPLSFVLIVPFWTDPPAIYLPRLLTARSRRTHLVLAKHKHVYIQGTQHRSHMRHQNSNHHFPAVHATGVFILQNDAGFEKWPPTKAALQAIRKAFSG
jgi:phosphorylated CTD-interacting factor 1